jgi:hypothetical protein
MVPQDQGLSGCIRVASCDFLLLKQPRCQTEELARDRDKTVETGWRFAKIARAQGPRLFWRCAVSRSGYATVYQAYERLLSELQDQLLTGEVVSDRTTIERLIRVVGAVLLLHDRHRIDQSGRCSICWPTPRTWWRPWPKRSVCTVHAAFSFFFQQHSSQDRRNEPAR